MKLLFFQKESNISRREY